MRIAVLFLLIPFLLFGDAGESFTVQARNVHFSSGEIVLEGGIQLGHSVGKVSAREARLRTGTGRAIESVDLCENIRIELGKAGTLTCWSAHIDTRSQTALFRSLLPLERVHFDDGTLSVDCHTMEVRVDARREGELCLEERLQTIRAKGAVRLETDDLVANAEGLIYWRGEPQETLPEALQGEKSLFDVVCFENQVKLYIGELVLATQGKIWLARTGEVGSPKGASPKRASPKRASPKRASPTLCSLVAKDGTQILIGQDAERKLYCPGLLVVNPTANRAYLQGSELEPLTYEDEMGVVTADTMVIDFSQSAHRLVATQINLQGHVKIRNRRPAESPSLCPQVALADHVVYFPEEERMVLRGTEDERVLFLDEAAKTRGSAPCVTFDRKRSLVEAHGAVRFYLSEEEAHQLIQRFAT